MKLNYCASLLCIVCLMGLAACKSVPKEDSVVTPAEPAVTEESPVVEPSPSVSDFSDQNDKLLAAAVSARDDAIAASVPDVYVDLYNEVEKKFETVKGNYANDTTVDYSGQIKSVTQFYQALTKAAEAQVLKKRIDNLDFSSYDLDSYNEGETALAEFNKLGKDSTSDVLYIPAEKAYESYLLVLNKAFKVLAGKERAAALEAKKNADSVSAGVSQKDAYIQAANAFKKADSDYVTQDLEGAYKGYQDSKTAFSNLYETVSKNRAAAQAAIDQAKQKTVETQEYAAQADTLAPLGDGEIKGIETEDKSLLEEDKFENPTAAIIDVNSGDTAQTVQSDSASQDAAVSEDSSVQEEK